MKINVEADRKILYETVISYAEEAGRLIKEHSGNIGKIEQKKNASDLVTAVDKMSEALLRAKIQKNYPEHWILSEEDTGQANSYEAYNSQDSGYGWIIDPIDGTTNFIHGIPHFSVSIGIVKNGEPIIGVVYNPLTDELYAACQSYGAYLNGQVINAVKESSLAGAVLATGFQATDWKTGSRVVRQIDQVAGKCRNVRMFGAASLDLCWVASGKITGFWHEGLNPWDTAAGILILQEAGGYVTDRDGKPYRLDQDSLVASNKFIHDEFLENIKL